MFLAVVYARRVSMWWANNRLGARKGDRKAGDSKAVVWEFVNLSPIVANFSYYVAPFLPPFRNVQSPLFLILCGRFRTMDVFSGGLRA